MRVSDYFLHKEDFDWGVYWVRSVLQVVIMFHQDPFSASEDNRLDSHLIVRISLHLVLKRAFLD